MTTAYAAVMWLIDDESSDAFLYDFAGMAFGGLALLIGGTAAIFSDQAGAVISLFFGALSIIVDIKALISPESNKISDGIVFVADLATSVIDLCTLGVFSNC